MAEKNVGEYSLRFDSEWTNFIETRDHWCLYWQQASLVEKFLPRDKSLVEIGVGSGFLSNYLRSRRWSVNTVDIDEDKKPDFVSDASQFDFNDLAPEAILAFEIFEHVPFPLFTKIINNISLANPKFVIFSLPINVTTLFSIDIKLPKLKKRQFSIRLPMNKIKTKNHFWELSGNKKTKTGVLSGRCKGVVKTSDVFEVFESKGYKVNFAEEYGRIKFFVAESLR